MAKLNDWLKGNQERQAKWIYDHESNSIECDKCRAEYKLSPYERVSILIIALTVVQEWRE